jgi:hypothetical protein
MKYISSVFSLILVVPAWAQSLVSTEPEPRRLVIEEFTGIYCGYCPDGASKVETILDNYPGQAVAVGIHSSNTYSQPQQSGHPDFRTTFGTSLQSLSGLSAFPAGMINRTHFPGWEQAGTSLAMNRNYWIPAADQIMYPADDSPVNIGLRSTWNETSRELTIDAEVYFTATEPAQDRLHIMITESEIIGYQSDYVNGSTNYYHHQHVLRGIPTGATGELISTTTQGTLFTKSYTFDIPASWNINNCDVVAFVTNVSQRETRTGIEVPALNGSTAISDIIPEDITMSVYPNPTQGESRLQFSVSGNADVKVEVLNLIGETVSEPFNGSVVANRTQVVDLKSADLKAGIYFVRVQVGQAAKAVKFHVLD